MMLQPHAGFPILAHDKELKSLCKTFLAAMPFGQWTHDLTESVTFFSQLKLHPAIVPEDAQL